MFNSVQAANPTPIFLSLSRFILSVAVPVPLHFLSSLFLHLSPPALRHGSTPLPENQYGVARWYTTWWLLPRAALPSNPYIFVSLSPSFSLFVFAASAIRSVF